MSIDKEGIVTQEETGEHAPIEIAEREAEKKLKELEQEAKDTVEQGLDEQN